MILQAFLLTIPHNITFQPQQTSDFVQKINSKMAGSEQLKRIQNESSGGETAFT